MTRAVFSLAVAGALAVTPGLVAAEPQAGKPTLFLIGDSTVKEEMKDWSN